MKFLFKLFVDALRHASNGPTPVRKSRKTAIGTSTASKNGLLTVILSPVIHSESDGSMVPKSTEKHATNNTRLLNRKLLSRETTDPIWFSFLRCGSRSINK